MSDDNALDQSEIERLLSGGGGFSAPGPPVEPNSPVEEGALSQAELEALFGSLGGTAAPAAPPPPPPPKPAPPAHAAIFPDSDLGTTASLDQSDIENLLRGAGSVDPTQVPAPPVQGERKTPHLGRLPVSATVSADEEGVPQGDIDYLLRRADEALDSISAGKMDLPNEVIEFQFPEFGGTIPNVEHATLDQISEVELDVKIELGRANMYLEDVLKLRRGSVVPLDKMAGDAVDIYVNNRLIARGEVLVMNENFCVRVAELLAGAIPME